MVQRGIYFFDNKPFMVKPWNSEMQINTEAITLLPIWVQFPELDIKYWGIESLSRIGSLLGIPIITDKYTKEKTMLQYACLLIEVSLEGPYPNYVEFVNDFNVVVRQKVKFEWMTVSVDIVKC